MILSLDLPRMGELMTVATVEKVYIAEGAEIKPGLRLLDVRVDLSAVAPQDCPPISFYRLVSRERGWVRRLSAAVGDVKEVGAALALIGTDPHETPETPPARAFRTTTAGVLLEAAWPPGTR